MLNVCTRADCRADFTSAWSGWERLSTGPATHPIFGQPIWHRLWWEHFSTGYDLLLVTATYDDSCIGIAPFKRHDGIVSFVASHDVTDFLDVIVDPDHRAAACDALIDCLADASWSMLDLRSLRPESVVLKEFPVRCEQRGWLVQIQDEDTSPAVQLSATWDDYVASLNKKDRHELRRKLRRLEGQGGVVFKAVTEPDRIDAGLTTFFHLHRLSRPDKAEFMSPAMEKYFRAALAVYADRGQVRLEILHVGQAPVAATISFETDDTVLLYNSGYDPAYSHLSVGLLSKALGLKAAIERGKKVYDFLRGNERYKYDLGGRDIPIYRLTVQRNGTGN